MGNYLYENKDTIKKLYGDTVNFAKDAIKQAKETVNKARYSEGASNQQAKEKKTADIYGTPTGEPNDWKPENKKSNNDHKYHENRAKIAYGCAF